MESQLPRERLMGDAIQTGHAFSRVKTMAQKRKASDKGKASTEEALKRMRGAEMDTYLSDMIDEANVIYDGPNFVIPTPLTLAANIVFPRGTEDSLAVIFRFRMIPTLGDQVRMFLSEIGLHQDLQ